MKTLLISFLLFFCLSALANDFNPALSPTRTWTCSPPTMREIMPGALLSGAPFDYATEGQAILFTYGGTTYREPGCVHVMDLTALPPGSYVLEVRTEAILGGISSTSTNANFQIVGPVVPPPPTVTAPAESPANLQDGP